MKLTRVTSCFHRLAPQPLPPSDRKHRRGHVLLLTLFILMVVVTSISLLARQSARRAMRAIDREDQMQQKWGRYSLETTMGIHAPRLYHQLNAQVQALETVLYPAQQRFELKLGRYAYTLLIGDENAKINLSHHKLNEIHPDIIIPLTSSETATEKNSEPNAENPTTETKQKTWSVYFPKHLPVALISPEAGSDKSIAARTTPWHNGKLNPLAISESALRAHLSGHLSPKKIKVLLEHRENFLTSQFSNDAKSDQPSKEIEKEGDETEEAADEDLHQAVSEDDQNGKENQDNPESSDTWHWEDAAIDLSAAEKEKINRLLIRKSNIYSVWFLSQRIDTPVDQPRYGHSVYEYEIQKLESPAQTPAINSAPIPLQADSNKAARDPNRDETQLPEESIWKMPYHYTLKKSQKYNW